MVLTGCVITLIVISIEAHQYISFISRDQVIIVNYVGKFFFTITPKFDIAEQILWCGG
jgi:hypothetical protein